MAIEYKPRDILTPIIEFIKSCPFLDDYNIDVSELSIQKLSQGVPESSAIDYIGSTQISDLKDINGVGYSERQANFNIWLARKSEYDFYRKEIAEFLFNFEQWVEHCQAYGLTPKISQEKSDWDLEVMTADNGIPFSNWEDNDSTLYMIQLHITYYNRYEEVL